MKAQLQIILDKWHGLTKLKKRIVIACAVVIVLVIVL